jgi:hypothetical protein
LHFSDFQTIGTPKQCQALLALYKLFIETKGNPDELELVVLCHRYYEALLRVHGIGAAKVACPSDQALCLGALFPDGQFQMANNTTRDCSASQFVFRCILIHLGRLESLGTQEFAYVEQGFAEDLDDKRSLRKETVMMQQVVVYLPEVYNMN